MGAADPEPGNRASGAPSRPGTRSVTGQAATVQAPLFEHVDHVAIAVHDIDASLPHYTERLRLPLVADEHADEPGVRLAYLAAGNAFLQLVQPTRSGPVADFLAERGEGLHHVCFAVTGIEPTLARLPGEDGARIFLGGRGRRACFLAGTANGALIELTETHPAGGADRAR